MGCGESRQKPSEEKAIILAESGLGFGLHDVSKLDFTIRKFSSNNMINESQLQRIANTLKLHIRDYPNNSKITAYFNKFKTETGEVSVKDLLVVAILLGVGSPASKARLLFQVFDEQTTERLSVEQLRTELFKAVITQAIRLGGLVGNGENPYSNENKAMSYCNNLMSVQNEAITRIIDKMNNKGNTFIQEGRFVTVLSGLLDGSMTSATGWRSYLNEIYVTTPKKQAFVNPFMKRLQKPAQS